MAGCLLPSRIHTACAENAQACLNDRRESSNPVFFVVNCCCCGMREKNPIRNPARKGEKAGGNAVSSGSSFLYS